MLSYYLWYTKGYDVEMWDLGLQEWLYVASTEVPELTLSNILSGILYRFRVTAITAEGGVSFPSDPSEPFVIDIPGVQVRTIIYRVFQNILYTFPKLSHQFI